MHILVLLLVQTLVPIILCLHILFALRPSFSSSPGIGAHPPSLAMSTAGLLQGLGNSYLLEQLLELSIPGYAYIRHFILSATGLDITTAVHLFVTCISLYKLSFYAYEGAWNHVIRVFSSSILISEDDASFFALQTWLAAQPDIQCSQRLCVDTFKQSAMEGTSIINASNVAASEDDSIGFTPAPGRRLFSHKGRRFWLEYSGATTPTGEDRLKTYIFLTLGPSTEPVKDLIREATQHLLHERKSKTFVFQPSQLQQRYRSTWSALPGRPKRTLDTIDLDPLVLADLIRNITRFLDKRSPEIYARKGIPYRRGYLLEGPPGTGKTSLIYAIAGKFGLDIYVPSITNILESELKHLFNTLSHRCIVILEDIDRAGFSDKGDQETSKEGRKDVSFSGLLNIIDGIASHEGHLLFMTTNYIERLDKALIRPGRIDKTISFKMSTPEQIESTFRRMFSPSSEQSTSLADPQALDLDHWAKKFSESVPTDTFSVAEIQAFIMDGDKTIEQACAGCKAWADELKATKLKGASQNSETAIFKVKLVPPK
jgi:mitochondrial chaperone BCS1